MTFNATNDGSSGQLTSEIAEKVSTAVHSYVACSYS